MLCHIVTGLWHLLFRLAAIARFSGKCCENAAEAVARQVEWALLQQVQCVQHSPS
jgi:hypothetical protein